MELVKGPGSWPPRGIIKIRDNRHRCPKCNGCLFPAGGTTDGKVKISACFDCNYRVEDIPSEEVKKE